MNPTSETEATDASDNPLSLVRPSWSDPSYALRTSYTVARTVTLPAGTPTLLCAADPRRWAVSFCCHTSLPAITPFSSATGRGLWCELRTLAGQRFSLSLMADGPLVCGELWGYSVQATDVDVIETLTQ